MGGGGISPHPPGIDNHVQDPLHVESSFRAELSKPKLKQLVHRTSMYKQGHPWYRQQHWSILYIRQSNREGILSNRVIFVFTSCDHRCHRAFIASRRQYEGNKKLLDCFRKATRLREALAMPLCSHRIIVRLHRDGTTVSAKTAECM